MYAVNDDMSIHVTRGDALWFDVSMEQDGVVRSFEMDDVLRLKVYTKKNCNDVVLVKDFEISAGCDSYTIYLSGNDTKFGGIISKPTVYWYEISLNPDTLPQTIIGYDDDGAKVFCLYPEGRDMDGEDLTPDDIPWVDKELDTESTNPIQNAATAKAIAELKTAVDGKLSKSGGTMTGHIAMSGKKVTGLGEPTNDGDAVTLGYANKNYVGTEYAKNNLVSMEYANENYAEAPMVVTVDENWTTNYSADEIVAAKESGRVVMFNAGILLVDISTYRDDAGVLQYLDFTKLLLLNGTVTRFRVRMVGSKAAPSYAVLDAEAIGALPAPESEGTEGQVLQINADSTQEWVDLPAWTAKITGYERAAVINETAVLDNYNYNEEEAMPLEIGDEVVIVHDGTEYTHTMADAHFFGDDLILYAGNLSLYNGAATDTGEPYVFYFSSLTNTCGITVTSQATVAVYWMKPIIEGHLPEVFLRYKYASKNYVDNKIGELDFVTHDDLEYEVSQMDASMTDKVAGLGVLTVTIDREAGTANQRAAFLKSYIDGGGTVVLADGDVIAQVYTASETMVTFSYTEVTDNAVKRHFYHVDDDRALTEEDIDPSVLSSKEQTLTEEQKAQARTNIGAASVETITTVEYEALEATDSNTLYVLSDAEEEERNYYTKEEIDSMLGVIENGSY